MKLIYDTIKDNLLLILILTFFGTMVVLAMPQPKQDKTIIQIEIDIKEIDKTLTSIEETIEEIFGKLEIEINTGD
tara:strand:- start:115 stop:339 length:225 start_codon:yes stop_codon:yes gene_type:complete